MTRALGVMGVPAPVAADDLRAYQTGAGRDGGLWEALRRLSDHDHSGGQMGAPIAGGGGGATEVTITGTEGVTVVESPANTFALGLTASPDASNTIEIRSNGLYSAAGAIPPEYVTEAEADARYVNATDPAGDTMAGPLTLPGDPAQPLHAATRQWVLGVGAALSDDLTAHAAAADPHPGYLTPAEGDARYRPLSYVTEVTVAGDNGVGVTESPANTFALTTRVSADGGNALVLRPTGLYVSPAATDPSVLDRISALEAQVATLQSQLSGHTHTSGTIDTMGGTAVLP